MHYMHYQPTRCIKMDVKDMCVFSITVQPYFIGSESQTVSLTLGKTHEVICEAVSSSPVEVTWLKGFTVYTNVAANRWATFCELKIFWFWMNMRKSFYIYDNYRTFIKWWWMRHTWFACWNYFLYSQCVMICNSQNTSLIWNERGLYHVAREKV